MTGKFGKVARFSACRLTRISAPSPPIIRYTTQQVEQYRLRVTDPVYERQYLQQPDGYYPVGECFLTISLGEPFQGYSYKLIAAIIK